MIVLLAFKAWGGFHFRRHNSVIRVRIGWFAIILLFMNGDRAIDYVRGVWPKIEEEK